MTDGVFTVVLTGGIASGKTAVSEGFNQLGVPVIDTDVIARELVQSGMPALTQISAAFGAHYLDSDGRLDRQKMRKAIFSSPQKKSRLEAILHPLIGAEVQRRIEQLNSPYCILVVPLYTESKSYRWVDRVLLVDVGEEVQIQRVIKRDRASRDQAEAILQAQASRQERLALANDVIDNSGSFSELQKKVETLHQHYQQLAD
jgi:dephospho-CoA kinase